MQRSTWLSRRLRAPIQEALSRMSGRTVTVGGVGGGLSGWLWLHDVSVGGGPTDRPWDVSMTAREVGLKLDAWDLLKGHADLGSLRMVQIDSPKVYVLHRGLSGTGQTGAGGEAGADSADWRRALGGVPIPAVRLNVDEGAVYGQQESGGDLVGYADQIRLSLTPPKVPEGWALKATARPSGGGKASFSVHLDPAGGAFEAQAHLKDLAWPAWAPTPEGFEPIRGRLNGDMDAVPIRGGWPLGLSLTGRGVLEGVDIAAHGRPGVQNFKAKWALAGSHFTVMDVSADFAGGHLSGCGEADLFSQSFAATLTAQSVDLGGLASAAGAPPHLGLKGLADVGLWAAGAVSAPALSVDLRSKVAQWQDHRLTGLGLRASGASGRWSGDGSLAWDGGQGSIAVDILDGRLTSASLRVAALPADWLNAWLGPLEGRLDGDGGFEEQHSAWDLNLKGVRLKVRGSPVDRADLQASGNETGAHLRFEVDLPGYAGLNGVADARRGTDGRWNLDTARLLQREKPLLQASGVWRFEGDGVPASASVTVRTAPLDVAFLLQGNQRGFTGTVQAEGSLAYSGQAWSGDFKAVTDNLARKGWAIPAEAEWAFSPSGVSLTGMSFRKGEVRGAVYAPSMAGPWRGSFTCAQASVPALQAATDLIPGSFGGTASGELTFFTGAPLAGSARLEIKDPWPKELPGARAEVDLRFMERKWNLERLQVEDGQGGRIKAQASVDFSGRAPWSGQAKWDHLHFSGLTTSGEARLGGGAGAPGKVEFSAWNLGGGVLPPAAFDLVFDSQGLESVEGVAGKELRCSLVHKERDWEAKADLTAFDPGPWLGPLLGRAHSTGLRFDGAFAGRWAPAAGTASMKAQFREASGGTLALDLGFSGKGLVGDAEAKAQPLDGWAKAARELGYSAPDLGGKAWAKAHYDGGKLSFSAKVDAMAWGGDKPGPLNLSGGWDGSEWIVDAASVGSESSGIFLKNGRLKTRPGAWDFAADVRAVNVPAAIFSVGTDAHLSVAGAGAGILAEAHCVSLTVGGRTWNSITLAGSWENGNFAVRQKSKRPDFDAEGSYREGVFVLDKVEGSDGKGRGRLKGSLGADGRLDFEGASEGLPAGDLTGAMGWDQVWTGSVWGNLKVTGNRAHVHTVVTAKVEDGSVQGLPFDLGTAYVVQDGDTVDLSPVTPIRISRHDGTALEVGGKVPLEDDPPAGKGMDVWAELKNGGLRLLAGTPGIESASGALELKLRFTGKPVDPKVDGIFRVNDGALKPAWALPQLEKAEVWAQIKDSRAYLLKGEARVAGGGPLFRVELTDPKRPLFVFERWVPSEFNARLRASRSGIPVQDTSGLTFMTGTLHPDLDFGGTWEHPTLKGEVLLEGRDLLHKGLVEYPPKFHPASKPGEPAWSDRIDYDLVIRAGKNVMVRTDAVQVFVDTGESGLRLTGGGDSTAMQGRLRLISGSVDYFVSTFRIASERETWIDFKGAEAPELELWGTKDLGNVQISGESVARDIQVSLHAWGPIGKVQMRLEGDDPSLTQDQLASILGLGSDIGDTRSQGGFTRMLGKVPASLITAWGRKTGLLDEVSVSFPEVEDAIAPTPQPGGAISQAAPAAQATPVTATSKPIVQVSVGKYVGSKIFVGVNTEVVQKGPEVGGVIEYQLPNKSRISVQRDFDDTGQNDDRVMLESSARFSNYDPHRRRWDLAEKLTPDPTPPAQRGSPTPGASPTPTPTAGMGGGIQEP